MKKKRFVSFVPVALAALGLKEFKKNKDGKVAFTEDEKATLSSMGFTDMAIAGMEEEANEPDEPEEPADASKAKAVHNAVVRQAMTQLSVLEQEKSDLLAKSAQDKADYTSQIEERDKKIAELTKQVASLSELPDMSGTQIPSTTGAQAPDKTVFDLTDDKQLGGMQGEMFALNRPYNQRARAAMLAAQGINTTVAAATPQDFSTLQADLGAFYRTRWYDRIQSFIVKLPAIFELFPMESGHQHLDTLVNVWFGEFSQADNTIGSKFENVEKGSYEFGTETLLMYGVMFVHEFKDLKQIEQLWIGYLNREGSNPVKLSFIEFLMVEIAKVLYNEQQMRFVNGVRVNPNPNEPGKAMEAADGIYEYLRKRIEGHIDLTPNGGHTGSTVYQIKPFDLPEITEGNIGEVFYRGTAMIPSQYRDTGNIVLYVPSFMMPWYHKYNEIHYGQNRDYEKNIFYVKEFPGVKIKTIPNADNHYRIFWTIDGNIKTYCHISGEMFRFNMEQHTWAVRVWSNWKESIQAEAVGKKFTDPAELDGSTQLIWTNNQDLSEKYFVEQKPDANPSALLSSSMVTVANDGKFTITDIENAPVGKVLTLKCGTAGDNGVTIKKADKFSLITADWNPGKGETIKLMKRADGKFIEISRGEAVEEETFQFSDDATTPSVAGGTVFITGTNTKATEITNLTDAQSGVVYTIYGAGSDNASTIKNGGNFVLESEMTLSDGKMIKLVKGAGGKFYEMSRA